MQQLQKLLPINLLHLDKKLPKEIEGVLIRWGTCRDIPYKNIIINKGKAISLASSKGKARKVMEEAGVKTPILTEPISFPVIARPEMHMKGKDFNVLMNNEELNKFKLTHTNYYYSTFIDKDHEYRVFCAHGKVLHIVEKPRPIQNSYCWNMEEENPWQVVPRSEIEYEVPYQSLLAVEAIGLDFGAVDVITKNNADGSEVYVLEINTAPQLSAEYTLEKWSKYFQWVERNPEEKHWDFKSFKKTSSLFWKNFQLNS